MVIHRPSVMPLLFRSIIHRVREVKSPFLSLLYWGATGSKCVNSPLAVTLCLSRTLLRFPSTRLSVLLSSSKLRTISVMHANLSILTKSSFVSSEVVIIFLPRKCASLPTCKLLFWQQLFLICYQQCVQRLPYLVLDVVTKHAKDGNLFALNQISKVNPFSPMTSVIVM